MLPGRQEWARGPAVSGARRQTVTAIESLLASPDRCSLSLSRSLALFPLTVRRTAPPPPSLPPFPPW